MSRVLLAAALGSIGIEAPLAVAWTGRSVDVNDVLLNVAGAALGLGVYELVRRRISASSPALT